jgi:hypothetical protein
VKDEAQLGEIRAYMRSHACIIREAYRHFAAISTSGPWGIGFNGFTDFRSVRAVIFCATCSSGVECVVPAKLRMSDRPHREASAGKPCT